MFAFYKNFNEVCKRIEAPVDPLQLRKKRIKTLNNNILQMDGANLIKLSVQPTLPNRQTAIMQIWCALENEPWSYACMKIPFSFFLSIFPQCGVLAFLAAQHVS